MAQNTPMQSPVERINGALDRLGLREAADQFVLVGGGAMVAYGLKNFKETDLDLVVTEDLASSLADDGRWKQHPRSKTNPLKAARQGITSWIADYPGYIAILGNVSAMVMPVDKIYDVSSDDLIAEGLTSSFGPYRFAPPLRILHWKLALADSPKYHGNKRKHVRDAGRLATLLMAQDGPAAQQRALQSSSQA